MDGGGENNSAFANDATSPPGLTRGSIFFARHFFAKRTDLPGQLTRALRRAMAGNDDPAQS